MRIFWKVGTREGKVFITSFLNMLILKLSGRIRACGWFKFVLGRRRGVVGSPWDMNSVFHADAQRVCELL